MTDYGVFEVVKLEPPVDRPLYEEDEYFTEVAQPLISIHTEFPGEHLSKLLRHGEDVEGLRKVYVNPYMFYYVEYTMIDGEFVNTFEGNP